MADIGVIYMEDIVSSVVFHSTENEHEEKVNEEIVIYMAAAVLFKQ